MRTVMQIVTFCLGVLGFLGFHVHIDDGDAKEVLANAILIGVCYLVFGAMVILPWALPLVIDFLISTEM